MKDILSVSCYAAPEADYNKLLRALGYSVRTGIISEVVPALRTGILSADLMIAECHALTLAENELLWQLRRTAPDVPLIVVSNCISVESYLRSVALGVQEYLCRPLGDDDIVHVAEKLLANETSMNKGAR